MPDGRRCARKPSAYTLGTVGNAYTFGASYTFPQRTVAMEEKIIMKLCEDREGITVVRSAECPEELGDFIEGCLEWLRRFGPVARYCRSDLVN